jgi:hypothetical protein
MSKKVITDMIPAIGFRIKIKVLPAANIRNIRIAKC